MLARRDGLVSSEVQGVIASTNAIINTEMNQFHLMRLLVPSAKMCYKKLYPKEQVTDYIVKNIEKHIRIPFLNHSQDSIGNFAPLPVEPYIHPVLDQDDPSAEDQDVEKEGWPFAPPSSTLRKNHIFDRVKSLQYAANNPCEDSLITFQLTQLEAYTVSVFDGHGGPELAQYCKHKINFFIDKYLKQHMSKGPEEIGKVIRQSISWSYQQLEVEFFEVYKQQLKLGNKKIRSVGACGITAIVHNSKVYIGNAGDSQAIFLLQEGNLVRAEKANERLSVNNRQERQRIMKEWKDLDPEIITEQSSNCFYLKGRLQPTRSIGDYYLKKEEYYIGEGKFQGPYLHCLPDIMQYSLTPAHRYIVMASDGLWDVLSRNEVIQALMNGKEVDLSKTCYEEGEQSPYINNALECVLSRCGQVSGHSLEELKEIPLGKRRNFHDDITIAVIDLGRQLQ